MTIFDVIDAGRLDVVFVVTCAAIIAWSTHSSFWRWGR